MQPAGMDAFSAADGFVARTWPFSDYLVEVERLPAAWSASGGPACLHLSGLAQVGDRIYASAEDLTLALRAGRIRPADIVDGVGFFTAVVRDGDDILFLNDLVGLEHVYVYDGPGGPIVGNRLHAISRHLAGAGVPREADVIYAATALSSHHPLFRQAHAHGLALAGLSLVPFDHYLALRQGRLERRRKPRIAEAFEGGGKSYSALIGEAAEELVRNVRVVRESGLFDHVSIDLSGGRDSRVMFGAALREGLLPRMPVNTRNEAGTDDLRCAQRLVRHYGAPHFTGDGHAEVALRPRDSLMLWRSYFGGMYHKLQGAQWSALGSNVRSVRFTGYCGEIYRSFWGRWFPDQLKSERTAMDGLAMVFDRVAPDFPKRHRAEAVEAFAKTILDLPGGSVVQKLDNHYLFFRNRTHFGMRAYHVFNQFVRWPALVSPSLLAASRMLPEAQGRMGKAMFDVLDRLAPELNFFAYAGRPWPDEIARSSPNYGRLRKIDRSLPDDFDRKGWDAAQAAVSASLKEKRTGVPFSRDGFKAFARDEVRRGIAMMRDGLPELAAVLGDDYAERTDRLFDGDDEWNWRVATSKIGSIQDIVLAEP